MKPGPALRAKRQQTRDARRRGSKSINHTMMARASWSSKSGTALEGQPRTRRIPAYEIRNARMSPQPPALVSAWQAYSGKRGQHLRHSKKIDKGDR